MVKHTQTMCRQRSTNCLSMFDHFVGAALKGLMKILKYSIIAKLITKRHKTDVEITFSMIKNIKKIKR